MSLRRHDLLSATPATWDAMLQLHPGLAELPLVAGWARLGWPVIVRRRVAGDAPGSVSAALPLPPAHGKLRVALSFPSSAGLAARPPMLLRDVAETVPAGWQAIVSALLHLGEAVGSPPRVFGALLWEHATGLPYLNPASDLDLLWRVSSARAAADLLDGLLRLDAGGPVRIDGELEMPDGAGVNWRELGEARRGSACCILAKTIDAVELRPWSGLFAEAGL